MGNKVWGDIPVSPRCPGGQNGTYTPMLMDGIKTEADEEENG